MFYLLIASCFSLLFSASMSMNGAQWEYSFMHFSCHLMNSFCRASINGSTRRVRSPWSCHALGKIVKILGLHREREVVFFGGGETVDRFTAVFILTKSLKYYIR